MKDMTLLHYRKKSFISLLHNYRLQWVTKRAKLPVVYWGSVSQAYENTKIVSLIAR